MPMKPATGGFAVASRSSLAALRWVGDQEPALPARLLALALRSRDPAVVDALVERAGGGPGGLAALRARRSARPHSPDRYPPAQHSTPRLPEDHTWVPAPMLSASAGAFTVALSAAIGGLEPGGPDAPLALDLAAAAVGKHEPSWWSRHGITLALHNAVLCGQDDRATAWLDQLPSVSWILRFAIEADLANPYLDRGQSTGPPTIDLGLAPVDPARHAAWEAVLSVPFVRGNRTPLRVDTAAATLFDGLQADSVPGSVDGPLVTVVMPTYAPDAGLATAVRSIVAQSYGNLEILVVDDCSGPDYQDLYDAAVASDPRVKLVQMSVNGGSYLGRNEAIRRSRGELITFQDGDDWSHPERIADQVAALRKQPSAPGSVSRAVRATDQLGYIWPGFAAQRDNASSLMVPRSTLEVLGPFQRVRKGADSEYHKRITHLLGEVVPVRRALAVTRLRAGSLSRSDFTVGWHHPDRVNYRNTFGYWHRTSAADDVPLDVSDGAAQPFPAPRSFRRALPHEPDGTDRFETVYLLDASLPTPLTSSDPEHRRLTESTDGRRWCGVLHLEDFGLVREGWEPFGDDVLRAIDQGEIELLGTRDAVHTDRLIALDAGVLETYADATLGCTADELIVVVRLPDEQGRFVDLERVSSTCLTLLGRRPIWAALDVREQQAWAADGWVLPTVAELREADARQT